MWSKFIKHLFSFLPYESESVLGGWEIKKIFTKKKKKKRKMKQEYIS